MGDNIKMDLKKETWSSGGFLWTR